MIVKDLTQVKEVYARAAGKGWVLPCICSENQTTTEAILAAASEFGKIYGIKKVPVIIAITVNYSHRSQAPNYTHSRDWKTGLKLFLGDIEALAGKGGLYNDVAAMIHLDHVQCDLDKELLESDLSPYSSIMYDASVLPFGKNIELTAAFVERKGKTILVEGACDEIMDATGSERNDLTTPANAERFIRETCVDMIVANLGTEHRASGRELMYHGELARKIKKKIGTNIVLHGTSSVGNDQVKELFDDGVCKVNIWTALERDSSPPLFEDMVLNASKTAGPAAVDKLIREGYLTEKCRTGEKMNLGFFTATYRQDIVYAAMKNMVSDYLKLWYK